MPAGDRTGPGGRGPMTGRGAGYCGGYGVPGYANRFGPRLGMGWGWGRGWGGGWRWRHWDYAPPPFAAPPRYAAPPTREDEMSVLKAEAEWLKGQLEAIGERIEELEKES
jgi:hypothetical protein